MRRSFLVIALALLLLGLAASGSVSADGRTVEVQTYEIDVLSECSGEWIHLAATQHMSYGANEHPAGSTRHYLNVSVHGAGYGLTTGAWYHFSIAVQELVAYPPGSVDAPVQQILKGKEQLISQGNAPNQMIYWRMRYTVNGQGEPVVDWAVEGLRCSAARGR